MDPVSPDEVRALQGGMSGDVSAGISQAVVEWFQAYVMTITHNVVLSHQVYMAHALASDKGGFIGDLGEWINFCSVFTLIGYGVEGDTEEKPTLSDIVARASRARTQD